MTQNRWQLGSIIIHSSFKVGRANFSSCSPQLGATRKDICCSKISFSAFQSSSRNSYLSVPGKKLKAWAFSNCQALLDIKLLQSCRGNDYRYQNVTRLSPKGVNWALLRSYITKPGSGSHLLKTFPPTANVYKGFRPGFTALFCCRIINMNSCFPCP